VERAGNVARGPMVMVRPRNCLLAPFRARFGGIRHWRRDVVEVGGAVLGQGVAPIARECFRVENETVPYVRFLSSSNVGSDKGRVAMKEQASSEEGSLTLRSRYEEYFSAPALASKKPYSWVKQKSSFKQAANLIQKLNLEGAIEKEKEKDLPYFFAGDSLDITYSVSTKSQRINTVRGICLGKRNNGLSTSFKLLCSIDGEQIEMTFPLYSPLIRNIRVIEAAGLHRGKKRVRRAKITYLRNRPQSQFVVPDSAVRSFRRRLPDVIRARRVARIEMLGEVYDEDILAKIEARKAAEKQGDDEQ